jgi:hypothetical protein
MRKNLQATKHFTEFGLAFTRDFQGSGEESEDVNASTCPTELGKILVGAFEYKNIKSRITS